MAREMNQADWRRDRNVRDEFGRLWLVAFETGPEGKGGSNMPSGQIDTAGWADPLATPQEYLEIPKGEFGEFDRNRITVIPGMKRWLAKVKDAERDWRQRFAKAGQKHYRDAFDPVKHAEDEILLDITGPRPRPSSAVITAALKGDKGYLGLAPLTKDQRAALGIETWEDMGLAPEPAYAEANPTLPPAASAPPADAPLAYPEFVRKMKEAGITDPKEVGAHWKTYKAELKAA